MTNNDTPKRIGRSSVRDLCGDDIIRDPKTGDLVRVVRVERHSPWCFIRARHLSGGHLLTVLVRNTAQLNIYA